MWTKDADIGDLAADLAGEEQDHTTNSQFSVVRTHSYRNA